MIRRLHCRTSRAAPEARPVSVGLRLAIGLAALLVALLIAARAAPAQQVEYPHGDTSEPLNCTLCHTQEGWSPAKQPIEFDHDAETGFPRTGRHAELTCTGCHLGLRFAEPKISSAGCSECHVDVHLGNLSSECTACHNTTSFNDVPGVGLHARTSLPLTGSHLQVSCETCHSDDTGGAYTTLDPDCYSCHSVDYETASLDHVVNGFSTDCESCHNTLAFGAGIAFDHVTLSGGFRLLGVHSRIACESCHVIPGFDRCFPASRVTRTASAVTRTTTTTRAPITRGRVFQRTARHATTSRVGRTPPSITARWA